jgi:hypothetical protein
MGIAEIHALPREEKLRLMELLWADLSSDDSTLDSPSWHESVLRETETRWNAGKEEALDWSEAKKELRRRFE